MISWFRKLFAASTSADLETGTDGPPYFIERRGQQPRMRIFSAVSEVQNALTAVIEAEAAGARLKQANRGHWHNIGDIELSAIRQAQVLIDGIGVGFDVEAYVQAVYGALDGLAGRYRTDDTDADGYGLGTVHAIKRVLETYDKQEGEK